jgi:hypothetical protein
MSKSGDNKDNKGVTTRAGAAATAAARQNNITNQELDYNKVFDDNYETHPVNDQKEAAVLKTWKDTTKQKGIGS